MACASYAHATESHESIPTDSDWKVTQDLPGSNACVARREGSEVNSMLMLNEQRELLLIAGRQDWERPTENKEIALLIDESKFERLPAIFYNNLVFLRVTDESFVRRLRLATTIVWLLPDGKYKANVERLGAAVDSLNACERKRHEQK